MSTGNIEKDNVSGEWPVRRADKLTAIYEPIV
jgi:hypothetical protein